MTILLTGTVLLQVILGTSVTNIHHSLSIRCPTWFDGDFGVGFAMFFGHWKKNVDNQLVDSTVDKT